MVKTTLCFLMREGEILLAAKKRSLSGFSVGVGKWNGVGGKIEKWETLHAAAVREIGEEIGVAVKESELEQVGNIKFYFKDKPDWNQQMHIFVVRNWEGEPSESNEMIPRWHKHHEIPYNSMWADDKH